jgi:hypothetical protein
MPKINSDIDSNQIKRIFEVLREETTLFDGYTAAEVELMSTLFKVLSFSK